MKHLMLACLLLALLGTTTFSATETAATAQSDPRLDQKVTIKAVGKPLGDFVKEVTAQTGVKMTAKKDAADIKVAVFIKDTPLSSLKDALKDCLHLQCTREGRQNEWTYTFWEDQKTKQDSERMKQEEVKKLHGYLDKLTKQLADMEAEGQDPAALAKELRAIAPEQLEKMAKENPSELQRFASLGPFQSGGTLAAITMYANLSQAQMQALWAGQPVVIRPEELSTGLQRKFMTRANVWIDQMREMNKAEESPSIVPDKIDAVTLSIDESGYNNKPCLKYQFNFARPENADEEAGFTTSTSSAIEVCDDDDMTQESDPSWYEGTKEEREARNTLKIKADDKTTPYQVMEQVFDLTGTCIVSDYYTRMTGWNTMWRLQSGYHRPFKASDDVLETIAGEMQSDLARTGDIRVLTSKSWPADRQREIPERLVAKWLAARKQYGGLRVQEAIELAGLSKLQLEDLELYGVGTGWMVRYCQPALRLAGSLNADQWQEAISEEGIPISKLSDSQFVLALAWARSPGEDALTPEQDESFDEPDEIRAGNFRIARDVYRHTRDDAKTEWEFTLTPAVDPKAVARTAKKALDSGEEIFDAPWSPCTMILMLSQLNHMQTPEITYSDSPNQAEGQPEDSTP